MPNDDRRAKVTPETKEESRRLRALWDNRPHPSQAEFGEKFAIGNQSAVGQFLRGDTPLSLKAARGFAEGLACRLEDFSPRLAAEAAEIAKMVPGDLLSVEVATLARQIDALPKSERRRVLMMVRELLSLAHESADRSTGTKDGATDAPLHVGRRKAG